MFACVCACVCVYIHTPALSRDCEVQVKPGEQSILGHRRAKHSGPPWVSSKKAIAHSAQVLAVPEPFLSLMEGKIPKPPTGCLETCFHLFSCQPLLHMDLGTDTLKFSRTRNRASRAARDSKGRSTQFSGGETEAREVIRWAGVG